MYQVLLFYKYCFVENIEKIILEQKKITTDLGLLGRILIADEGINGTLCGLPDACEAYQKYMKKHELFFDINFKKSSSDFICFKKLQVKSKNEIVILQADKKNISYEKSAKKITPLDLHKEIKENKDLLLFDMRNKYESRIGRFQGAICPQIETTRELEKYLNENKDILKDKDIVMYCTGGVRCERTSVLMKNIVEPKRLRHLENGIHAYAEQFPEGYFRGRNYVFDDRVSIKINEDILTHCDICKAPCALYNNCLNAICNKHYICCDFCYEKYNACCSQLCIVLTEKKTVPLRPMLPSRLKIIPSCIKENISLKQYTWFEIGGVAKYFATPKDFKEFTEVIEFKKKYNLSLKILGLGANVLVSDSGFNGIILSLPRNNEPIMNIFDNEYTLLIVQAGNSLEETINFIFEKAHLIGLEEFSGIPSSIGGALFINIHYYKFLIAQFVYEAKVYDIEKQEILTVSKEWFNFSYDNSTLKKNNNYVLWEVTFLLKKANELEIAFAKGRSVEIIRHRKNRYPYEKTCGCFFRNFLFEEINKDNEFEGKKILAASYYIDQIGLKGNLKIGNSFLSSKHANMITHEGEGNAKEIISIARTMQQKVFEKFNLLLEPECELIGFEKYPLYTKKTILEKN